MVSPFGKQIGNSLVPFGVGHHIVKNEYVPLTLFYNVGRLDDLYTIHKFYPGYSLPNDIVEGLPLSKTPYDSLR